MEPAVRSGIADAPVVPAVPGMVSRHALFGRLGTAGRVAEVAAPTGSGKTMLDAMWQPVYPDAVP
jgi:ATP/maltotriose-dependent transcriptional regulator MalT